MYEFLEYVLSELHTSLGLVCVAGVAALAVLVMIWIGYRKRFGRERHFPWGKACTWLIFVGYCAIVLYATILRGMGGYREWNLHLFRAWREAWNNYSVKNWANVLLNIAMFVPLGFLLPLLGRAFRRWYLTIPAGFAVSVSIELLQLAIGRGICDVDDLFCNTAGAMIGYFIVGTFLSLKEKHLRSVLIHGCAALASFLAIGSIFLAYAVQPYGNLPQAAAYRNNTGATVWTLECTLPEEEAELPVYRTQTRTIAQCDAFAEAFRKIIGTEYTTISYYQDAAYYMDQSGDENGSHFLFLSYLDPGYEYHCGYGDTPVWAEADRETIEAAISHLPLLLPEYAEFTAEGEGWHTFTVDRHIDGAVMVDGTLRCRYALDGTVREVENDLLSYTYHDTVAVISPEEAYRRLCRGEFYDEGYFEHKNPSEVTVSACTRGYEIDTKGFYQPVYFFEAEAGDGSYSDRIMIPAIK